MNLSEWRQAYEHWSKVARYEFNRSQIVETAADPDYRGLSSPVWHAMQDELLRRDKLDLARIMRAEVKAAKLKDKNLDRRKLRLKNQRLANEKIPR